MTAHDLGDGTDTSARDQEGPRGDDLSSLQRWMAGLIQRRGGIAKDPAMQAVASAAFAGSAQLSPAQQIDIYRQQFWLRHTSSLVEDFPGVTGIVGQEEWERIVESYLVRYPPRTFQLRHLGQALPKHLAELDGVPHRSLLVEMARLEWDYINIFDEQDDPALNPEFLSQIPESAWASAKILLSGSLRLERFEYPVADLRRELRARGPGATAVPIGAPEPHRLAIYRRDGNIWDKRLSETAFRLLSAFQDGLPLVEACERVVSEHPEAEAVLDRELTAWFGLWGRIGWVVGVEPA